MTEQELSRDIAEQADKAAIAGNMIFASNRLGYSIFRSSARGQYIGKPVNIPMPPETTIPIMVTRLNEVKARLAVYDPSDITPAHQQNITEILAGIQTVFDDIGV